MADRLRGKRALVTAAGQGMGRAAVEAFVREGARVVATDVDAALLENAFAKQVSVQRERLDVLDDAAVRSFV